MDIIQLIKVYGHYYSRNEIHWEVGEEGSVLIALHEIDKEIAVVIRAEYFFGVSGVLTVFYNVRSIVATRTFAIPVLNPKAMFFETVRIRLVRVSLEIAEMPFTCDRGFVSNFLKHLTKCFEVKR